MDLERLVEVGKCRAWTKVHHPTEGASSRLRANRVYPLGRQKFSRRVQLDVQRRIPEIATALAAGHDAAAERIGPTKRRGGALEIAVGDRRSDAARRHRGANGVTRRWNDIDVESARLPQLHQQGGVPVASATEA